jgi:hypothetical protein
MKAYGRRKGDELEYGDLGCPSKHRRLRNRKSGRRILHKQGRRDGSAEIRQAWCEMG